MKMRSSALAALALCSLATAAAAAPACVGSGIITRIEGVPQEVQILRLEEDGQRRAVARPRILEVICAGDTIHADKSTVVSLSLDGGAGRVRVDVAHPYTVAARGGAPTVVGNAYRQVNEHLLPDMKRQPWDVRVRGGPPPLTFSVAALSAGGQSVRATHSTLLVRLSGGVGPYRAELRRGDAEPIAAATSQDGEVLLTGLKLSPGAYVLRATDRNSGDIQATITVVDAGPVVSSDYAALPDPESAAAAAAADLARTVPQAWSFEAEQMLAAAPTLGLDRSSIYELIESYAAD